MTLIELRLLWAVDQAKTHAGARHAGGPKHYPERELYRRAKIKSGFRYRSWSVFTIVLQLRLHAIPRRDIGWNAQRGAQRTMPYSSLERSADKLLSIPSRQICTDARYTHYPPSQPTSNFEIFEDASPRPLCLSLPSYAHTHTHTHVSKHASARLTSHFQGTESLLQGTGRRSPAAHRTPSPVRPSWS